MLIVVTIILIIYIYLLRGFTNELAHNTNAITRAASRDQQHFEQHQLAPPYSHRGVERTCRRRLNARQGTAGKSEKESHRREKPDVTRHECIFKDCIEESHGQRRVNDIKVDALDIIFLDSYMSRKQTNNESLLITLFFYINFTLISVQEFVAYLSFFLLKLVL